MTIWNKIKDYVDFKDNQIQFKIIKLEERVSELENKLERKEDYEMEMRERG